LLDDRITARKECARKIKGEGGVGVEVVPLDEIADLTDEDRPEAATHVGKAQLSIAGRRSYRNLTHPAQNPAVPRKGDVSRRRARLLCTVARLP
jgi:hypothetical protein